MSITKNPINEVVIGKRFREIRELLKKRQVDFAKELSATQANISQIESGKCMPTGNYFLKLIERVPNINMNWVFFGEGDPLRVVISKKKGIKELDKKTTEELMLNFDQLNKKISKLLGR